MNALTDEALMLALVRAGQQGVKHRPDRARRLHAARAGAGRDRQHPRALHHRALPGAFAGVLLPQRARRKTCTSSADWMNRNMLRRIELAWPVTDPGLRQRIIDECLVAGLHDGRDAWDLGPDGAYRRVDTTSRAMARRQP
jgi:polyphosphate kinase